MNKKTHVIYSLIVVALTLLAFYGALIFGAGETGETREIIWWAIAVTLVVFFGSLIAPAIFQRGNPNQGIYGKLKKKEGAKFYQDPIIWLFVVLVVWFFLSFLSFS